MYSVVQPAAFATEMHVSGRSKNIKEIDLAAVFLTREDREMLALITSFDLSHNRIEKLQQLDALTALTRLNASHNKIAAIGFLPVTITELDVSHNNLMSLEGIGCLPHLRDLNVGYNRLQKLIGLSRSQPLHVLRAEGNRIVTTVGLESMVHLRFLSLDHNLIDNANELYFLPSTPSLEMLSLRENPVANMNGYRVLVARLQASVLSLDGVPLLRAEALLSSAPNEIQQLPETQVPLELSAACPIPVSNATALPAFTATPTENCSTAEADRLQRGLEGRVEAPMPSNKIGPKCFEPRMAVTSEIFARDIPALSEYSHNNSNDLLSHHGSLKQQRLKKPGKATLQMSQEVTLAKPRAERGGKDLKRTETFAVEATKNALALPPPHVMERKLHETEVLLEDLRKENDYLRTRNRKVGDQLKDARRVITSQLDEISRLRLRLSSAEENENKLKDRLDKIKRGARVVDRHSHNTVDAMKVENERLKAVYEAQIADLRQQLRRAQRQIATAVNATVSQTSGTNRTQSPPLPSRSVQKVAHLDDNSVEIQAVIVDSEADVGASGGLGDMPLDTARAGGEDDTPNRLVGLRATDVGKLAVELKNWLYAEMAEDARRVEEDNLLDLLRQSMSVGGAATTE
ncbi:putative leucine-rich repeat protein (LRRP) [Trypanosoma rangeli]|uniref:Putative leucine-rich repeat protein (LRRP) n=1 Tax=Trypanosoma rangeli TaxID=5698 RepID=A0A3S5IQN8_TRYRA|nr:putative leucine-rich repeat protein (LRRP) [Trypanosoma rangeli]RNF01418.1 putative leucine-rich repeat protein (LRRP) [Trypanosoma rangeli]|eukprot:RNF01418.1 putative leucine-rich repeat protein (LRRP) [Trypanosoma rangeli]